MVVEFPLRGEWVAYHTPAERIPSHGTDQLGQRFAYDFLRIERDKPGWKFCRASMARYHAFGVPLRDCYAWGQPDPTRSRALQMVCGNYIILKMAGADVHATPHNIGLLLDS